jgi:hypothetical protein
MTFDVHDAFAAGKPIAELRALLALHERGRPLLANLASWAVGKTRNVVGAGVALTSFAAPTRGRVAMLSLRFGRAYHTRSAALNACIH